MTSRLLTAVAAISALAVLASMPPTARNANAKSPHAADQNTPPDWTESFPAFKIVGNVYYVGSRGLASYLITTPKGHILINSNLESSVPQIRESVEKLGFHFSDVKILRISHAHWDHDAGSATIKKLTGAQYYLSHGPVRESVRRLVEHGVLRLIERTKTGHLVEPRLPEEIRSLRGAAMSSSLPLGSMGRPSNLEKLNFMKTRALRQSIHSREGGKCFYCLRRIPVRMKCLDHVIPRVQFGRNSYRNLVSCCMECNSAKKEHSAADYLRSLYRDGRLTATELNKRLRALNDLATGKLRPAVPSQAGDKKERLKVSRV